MTLLAVPTTTTARTSRAVPLVVLLLLVAAGSVALTLVVSGGAPQSTAGLRDSGPVTAWMAPLVRMLLDLTTFGTLGCLAVAGWLMPVDGDRLTAGSRALLRTAARWSSAWALSALCLLVVGTAQLVGERLTDVVRTPALYRLAWQVPQNRALLVIVLVGVAVGVAGSRAQRPGGTRLLPVGASLAMVPLLLSGHAQTASNHYLAAQSLVVHVVAASLWVGGLMALALHLRRDLPSLRVVLPRFSRLALCCFVAVALSGAVGAWVRLGTSWSTWHSTYGGLLVAKTVALVVLGLLGMAHRRWSLPRVADGRRYAFARFAVVEAVVMVVAAGLAVVLARTAPPTQALTRATPPHANTFPTVDRGIDPVSPWTLLTWFRPDALVLTVAAVALVGYLLGARQLRRQGTPWPLRRSALFACGVLVAVWALCGGLGSYSGALFSAEVGRLLTLGIPVPVLLTAAAPLTLARLVLGEPAHASRMGRLADPVNGLAALVLVLAAALMTPLLEASLRSPTLHLALAGCVLAAGLLFSRPLLGLDRLGSGGRHDTEDGSLLVVVLAALLVVYAGHIYTSTTLFAAGWFSALDWWWGDAAADQQRGALVAGGYGLALLVGAVVLRHRRGQAAVGA